MSSSAMWRRVARVRTDVSEEHGLHHQGDKNRRAGNVNSNYQPKSTAKNIPPKHRFLQETHDVTSQKPALFAAIAMKTSNLTYTSLI
jgi:hypothetical protein